MPAPSPSDEPAANRPYAQYIPPGHPDYAAVLFPDEGPESPELAAVLDATTTHAQWHGDLEPEALLTHVLETYPAANWSDADVLKLFATCYDDAAQWMKIKAVGKALGVNVYDLERAVKVEVQAFQALRAREFPELTPLASRVATPVHVAWETVTPADVPWFWYPYIPLGMLTMLDGDPGIGKSLLTIALAAHLSQARPLPDVHGHLTMAIGACQATLFLAGEDSLAHTMVPRFLSCGGDPALVESLVGWHGAEAEPHAFTLADMDVLRHSLARLHPTLVIIDPIQAYLGPGIDMHRANEIRPLLSALAHEAERYQCSIVCIRHQAKANGGGKAMMRGLGTIDFAAMARSVLVVEQHPTLANIAILAQAKNNLAPLGRTLKFSKAYGLFAWAGTTRLSAELLAGSGHGPYPYAFFQGFCWLEERLEGDQVWPAADLVLEAEEQGISKKVLYAVKKALGVVSRQQTDGWFWRLPPYTLPNIPPPPLSTTHVSGSSSKRGNTGSIGVSDSNIEDEGTYPPYPLNTRVTPDTPVAIARAIVREDVSPILDPRLPRESRIVNAPGDDIVPGHLPCPHVRVDPDMVCRDCNTKLYRRQGEAP